MKTSLVAALSVLTLCGNAAAQSSVVLYGSLDQSAVRISNIGGSRLYRLDPGTTQPDRFGFRGTEDLGGGLTANFALEAGFSTDTGSLINTAAFFNRTAVVGLSGGFGSVLLGHQPDLMFDWVGKTSNGFQLANFYAFHPGNFDTLANTFQYDNAIRYNTPAWNGLTLGGIYGFGESPDGSNRTNRNLSAGANYLNGPVRVAAAYSVQNNRTLRGFGPFAGASGLPASGVMDQVKNAGIGATYRLPSFGVNAAYSQSILRVGATQANLRNVDLGLSYNVTAANAVNVGYTHSKLGSAHWNTVSLMNLYSLSKRTQIYVQGTFQQASQGQVAMLFGAGVSSNEKQNIVGVGVHHSF